MDINALFPSNYLKASDVATPKVLTIRGIEVEDIGQDGQKKPVLYFYEEKRGLVMNKTNAGLIAHFYGNDTDQWEGKPLELYREPVSFQGRIVDAIRVRVPQKPDIDPTNPSPPTTRQPSNNSSFNDNIDF